MEKYESVLHRLGLPPQFGLSILLLSLALAVAPYLANTDFGALKIPSFDPRTRRRLRGIGPIALVVAILVHVPFLRSQPQAATASAPSASTVSNLPALGETFLGGTVLDERTGAAVSTATITAADRWTTTDSTGTFRLSIPAADRVRIAVTAPGFTAVAVEVVPPQASLVIALREEEK